MPESAREITGQEPSGVSQRDNRLRKLRCQPERKQVTSPSSSSPGRAGVSAPTRTLECDAKKTCVKGNFWCSALTEGISEGRFVAGSCPCGATSSMHIDTETPTRYVQFGGLVARMQEHAGSRADLIAASIYYEHSVCPSIRPICTSCCFSLTIMFQVCRNFR